ncbi:hypothetical protein EVG20_g5080 [Dentipellis fragilis]|uniref:alpha,alpha-trehalase n=1 Tax=Dentipellis fragilis TaxID=205917 RepID=A0A4Y9YY07_9AGAM|nr:hypothetical protein EVG20_g5080 [Dentipellis fragilis]
MSSAIPANAGEKDRHKAKAVDAEAVVTAGEELLESLSLEGACAACAAAPTEGEEGTWTSECRVTSVAAGLAEHDPPERYPRPTSISDPPHAAGTVAASPREGQPNASSPRFHDSFPFVWIPDGRTESSLQLCGMDAGEDNTAGSVSSMSAQAAQAVRCPDTKDVNKPSRPRKTCYEVVSPIIDGSPRHMYHCPPSPSPASYRSSSTLRSPCPPIARTPGIVLMVIAARSMRSRALTMHLPPPSLTTEAAATKRTSRSLTSTPSPVTSGPPPSTKQPPPPSAPASSTSSGTAPSSPFSHYVFNLASNARNSIFAATSFYSLWAGIIPPEALSSQSAAFGLFASLNLVLNRYNGTFPTTSLKTGLQWDAPDAWPPHQYIALQALAALPANITTNALPGDGHIALHTRASPRSSPRPSRSSSQRTALCSPPLRSPTRSLASPPTFFITDLSGRETQDETTQTSPHARAAPDLNWLPPLCPTIYLHLHQLPVVAANAAMPAAGRSCPRPCS